MGVPKWVIPLNRLACSKERHQGEFIPHFGARIADDFWSPALQDQFLVSQFSSDIPMITNREKPHTCKRKKIARQASDVLKQFLVCLFAGWPQCICLCLQVDPGVHVLFVFAGWPWCTVCAWRLTPVYCLCLQVDPGVLWTPVYCLCLQVDPGVLFVLAGWPQYTSLC